MKYRISLSVLLATSLLLSSTVTYAQEGNSNKSVEKSKKENTSKAIDFEKAQKMSPQALKNQLTPEDLKLHNKVADHNSVEMRTFVNRAYQDVNTYIVNYVINTYLIDITYSMNNIHY